MITSILFYADLRENKRGREEGNLKDDI